MSPTRALKSRLPAADVYPTALESDGLPQRMRERVALLGGRLHIESAVGFGAHLTGAFPIYERA